MTLYKQALFLFSLVIFNACSKSTDSDKCPPSSGIQIETEYATTYLDGSLRLNATTTNANTNVYKWSGPGGWTSDQSVATRNNMQTQDGGVYSVRITNQLGCLVYEGSKNINVVPVPAPPCSPTNNTVTGTLPVGNFNFPGGSSAYAASGGYYYTVINASGLRLDINFLSSNPPNPGVYTTVIGSGNVPDFVYVYIHQSGGQWGQYRSTGGDQVYVTKVNGKLVVSFCDLRMYEFGNPFGDFKITGKLTPY